LHGPKACLALNSKGTLAVIANPPILFWSYRLIPEKFLLVIDPVFEGIVDMM
jgi:hypothetical protein